MQQITSRVYVETKRRGANPGFVTTSQGVVMIDTPYRPSDALMWREEIASRGEVRYLINTEHHFDHFTGNYFFSGTVVSHQETRKRISWVQVEQVRERIQQMGSEELRLVDKYQTRIPAVTFSERMTLYVGDRTFDLIHLPGHTSGQIAVHIPEERILFTGDNIFYKVQAFLHEADPFQWLQSLKRIEEMDVDVIVPGHGEICNRSCIPELASFIQDWVDAVRGAIDNGLSKEEAMDKISFLNRYPMDVELDAMGPTVQRWNVECLYNILTK